MAAEYNYQGSELDAFAGATNWKRYFARHIQPYLRGRVLEVGAGIGSNTRTLPTGRESRWLCLEPDTELVARLLTARRQNKAGYPRNLEVFTGFVEDLEPAAVFDAIVYLDVLEHIADDRRELESAATRLAPDGHLIVLSPAWPSLYSPFDKAIGHFRRYRRDTLSAAAPSTLRCTRLCYLDSVGLLASLANRWLLKSPAPTRTQIEFWDRRLVPLSRWLDPILGYRIGKSVLGVWGL